jgi:hypothetical protein
MNLHQRAKRKAISYALLTVSTMLGGILACGGLAQSGITEANVRVTGLPQFVCPTDTPMPTHTPLPTATQRATATRIAIATPMVYATNPPTCNYSQSSQLSLCLFAQCLHVVKLWRVWHVLHSPDQHPIGLLVRWWCWLRAK